MAKRMSNYYVSGCVADGDDVSTCDDSVAQFWTLYRRNEEGLSEGIIDCMFREDAEAAMRVYKERDALAALTEPAADLADLVPDVDEESPFKVISISWLKCKCGNTKIDVTTINGNAHRLCEDDDAMCNSCGRKGIIQCNEGCAGVLWETDEEYAESKRAAILRNIEEAK